MLVLCWMNELNGQGVNFSQINLLQLGYVLHNIRKMNTTVAAVANMNTSCSQEVRWERLLIVPVPVLSFLLNLIVFVAVSINREKLQRQNYLFICVSSTLFSNLLYLVFHLWILFDNHFHVVHLTYGSKANIIWSLCQAAVVSSQFIMCGNIGALLVVVLDSTYFVGRSINRKASEFANDANGQKHWAQSMKGRKAIFLIAIAWLIPICFIIAAAVKWNCTDSCINCGARHYIGDPCSSDPRCSHIWSPLHSMYLIVHVVLWVVELLFLISIIYSGIRSFREVMAPPKDQESNTELKNEAAESNGDREILESSPGRLKKPDEDENGSSSAISDGNSPKYQNVNQTPQSSTRAKDDKSRPSLRYSSVRLHPRINFMITICLAFFFSTCPLIISIILDVSSQQFNYAAAEVLSTFFIHIYTLACPIILVKHLPHLRSIIVVMFRNCSCSKSSGYKQRNSSRNR